MSVVEVWQGSGPVVLALPHTGTEVPDDVRLNLNEAGKLLADTDWHAHRLFDDLLAGATLVRSKVHRYVIDANRDPFENDLYDDQNNTALVPLTDFTGEPIWTTIPDDDEIRARLTNYHAPYHAALRAELKRVHADHGCVILVNCHGVKSRNSFLFSDALHDISIGTYGGASCAHELEQAAINIAASAPGRRAVLNGRFKGGWTTRQYGRPADGLHAIQLEVTQATYLHSESPPWSYDDGKAKDIRLILARILSEFNALAPHI